MKTLVLLIILVLGMCHIGLAGTTRYDAAQFYWTYKDNPDAPGNTFVLRCGRSSNNYTIQRFIPMEDRAILIQNVLPRNSGSYYCRLFVNGETDSNQSPQETKVTTRGNFVDY